jgi:hypothetical protein
MSIGVDDVISDEELPRSGSAVTEHLALALPSLGKLDGGGSWADLKAGTACAARHRLTWRK